MTKHVLFLCSQNKLRSPTAEAIYSNHPGVEVDSAGLNNDVEVPVSEEQIDWPAPTDAQRRVSEVPPGSILDRGISGEGRSDDRPAEGGTLNSGDVGLHPMEQVPPGA